MTKLPIPLDTFVSFGELLWYLRRRQRLTLRQLAAATGCSETKISLLESNQDVPDLAALETLFIPALKLQEEPETVDRLLMLARSTVNASPNLTPRIIGKRSSKMKETKEKHLPTGMVAFLFTDIEGSTPLWEKLPGEMQVSLTQHNEVLNRMIERNGGSVFQIVGDAFQAAFPSAAQALQAAVDIQHALNQAEWGPTGPLKVRIGLHCGYAELDSVPGPGGSTIYAVSHTLNRAARIMSAGHGKQILISKEAVDLLHDSLPLGITLRDLGEHFLKGMEIPEHLYQVAAEDLPQDFPPLSSIPVKRHNLPVELTSLVGREADQVEIAHLLSMPATHLLTLVGSGGIGKTQLALRSGANLVPIYKNGVWLVELAPLSDPSLVMQAVVTALGLQIDPNRLVMDTLVDFLKDREMLLILDNCEHLIEAASQLASGLLRSCAYLRILATSREPLGVMGEVTYRVPSLALPPQGWDGQPEISAAVELFLQRAANARPGFCLAAGESMALARICRRLDGIPLAIELAAARVGMLTVSEIVERLEEDFRVLGHGGRAYVPRHATLRAAVDWSYKLLSAPEQALLRRLPLFIGGWSLEQAEKICSFQQLRNEEILDLLGGLVSKSMVLSERLSSGVTRYRLHEMVRQYAFELLIQSGEENEVRARFQEYFLNFAEAAESALRGSQQMIWLSRLDDERDNIIEANNIAHAHQDALYSLRLSGALTYYWVLRDFQHEGWQWLKKSLAMSQGTPHAAPVRAKALAGLIWLGANWGQPVSHQVEDECLQLCQTLNDQKRLAFVRSFIEPEKNPIEIISLLQASLPEIINEGDHWMAGHIFGRIADLERWQGNFEAGRSCFEKSVQHMQQAEDQLYLAQLKVKMTWLEWDNGNIRCARDLACEAVSVFKAMGQMTKIAMALTYLCKYNAALGNTAESNDNMFEALHIFQTIGAVLGTIYAHQLIAQTQFQNARLFEARSAVEKAQKMIEENPLNRASPWEMGYLGMILLYEEKVDQADALLSKCLEIVEQWGHHTFLQGPLRALGQVRMAQGDMAAAGKLLSRSFEEITRNRTLPDFPETLDCLANLEFYEGNFEQAARLLGASDGLLARMEMKRYPIYRPDYERCIGCTREALAEEAFSRAYLLGWQAANAVSPACVISQLTSLYGWAQSSQPGSTAEV